MAFPNVSDIIATTIESRSKKVADNVTKNNALLAKLSQRGRMKTFSGGRLIYEELSFAENGNAGWYSGYDLLPVAAQDVLSAAQFDIRQAACPVVISGLEMLQNAGPEQMIDLLSSRLDVAESTMRNLICGGIYSDGTGSGGKEITGLNAAVPLDPTTGTYGGIDRATWNFWRSKVNNSTDATNIQTKMNALWASLVRGSDRPDLIVVDNVVWQAYLASLQAQQRFMSSGEGNLGFPSIKFMDCDVVLDGGIGGFCPAGTGFFLNTNYIKYRPHAQRNFVPLSPNKRYSINQDAEVQILGWAGNLTTCGAQFQGRLDVNA
ncbi:major capsid protein [Stenotrophomonas phage BUCT555]|nr:major capsid protein [Stenotrophomonas phage BUCT555]